MGYSYLALSNDHFLSLTIIMGYSYLALSNDHFLSLTIIMGYSSPPQTVIGCNKATQTSGFIAVKL